MQTVHIDLKDRSYDIHIGFNLDLGSLARNALPKTKDLMIVTNDTIAPLYLDKVKAVLTEHGFNCKACILKDGEVYKTIDSYMQIMTELLQNNFGRDCALVALGGGVVGDMTGFAAATFQRGVNFIQIPTTLLALVDSSVGGKTAINHPMGKNMIGAFYQPQVVIADLEFLHTLDERQVAAGMAEVIKYGVILDHDFFVYLKDNIKNLDLAYVVKRCCELKALVVSKDEQEKGLRALLNYGHTFGHAIEVGMGFGNYLHGEAVSIGMAIAAYVSFKTGRLVLTDFEDLCKLLQQYNLPVHIPANLTEQEFVAHMHHDKKVKAGKVNYVLPTAIGSAEVVSDLDDSTVERIICEYNSVSL